MKKDDHIQKMTKNFLRKLSMLESFKKRVFSLKNSESKGQKDLAKLRNNSSLCDEKLSKIRTQNQKYNWQSRKKLPPLIRLDRIPKQNSIIIQEDDKNNPSELKLLDNKFSSIYSSDPKRKFLQPIQKKKRSRKNK